MFPSPLISFPEEEEEEEKEEDLSTAIAHLHSVSAYNNEPLVLAPRAFHFPSRWRMCFVCTRALGAVDDGSTS